MSGLNPKNPFTQKMVDIDPGDQHLHLRIDNYPSYSSECYGNNLSFVSAMNALKKAVQSKKTPKPSIVMCSGNSGLGIGSVVSFLMGVPVLHLRNDMTTRNTGMVSADNKLVVPNASYKGADVESYFFVDDLLDSGKTFTRCLYAMYEINPKAYCAGILLVTGDLTMEHHQSLVMPYLTDKSIVIYRNDINYNGKPRHAILYGDGTTDMAQ